MAAAYRPGGGPHFVYCLTNLTTGRYYIGYSTDPGKRYRQHKANPPKRARADARKYAPWEENFVVAILADAWTKESAQKIEEFLIWKFRATEAGGYNASRGASDCGIRLC